MCAYDHTEDHKALCRDNLRDWFGWAFISQLPSAVGAWLRLVALKFQYFSPSCIWKGHASEPRESTQADSQVRAETVVSMYRHNEYQVDMVGCPEVRCNILASYLCSLSLCTIHHTLGSLKDLQPLSIKPLFSYLNTTAHSVSFALEYPLFPKAHPTALVNFNSSFKSQFSYNFALDAFPASCRQSCIGL